MVLNPDLYRALKGLNRAAAFADPKISNQGVPATFHVTVVNGVPKLSAEGEHYAICCVECSDSRHRLYVHHAFGQTRHILGFNQPGDQLLSLAYCHNCGKRIRLTGYIEGYVKVAKDTAGDTMAFLNGATATPVPKRACPPMGLTIPVHEVDPRDPAVTYLKKRKFDINYLGQVAGAVVMIEHPDFTINKLTRGRIGFPFYVDGEMKTWQARSPYDLKKGEKWPPKWWFPGQTEKVPWNVDVAAAFDVCILCEGILSAVNMGPAALAVGGKTLTVAALEIIKRKWKRALVALDPDCGVNRKPGEVDYHDRMIGVLQGAGIHATGVKWTPGDNRDPGDLSLAENIELIRCSDPLVAGALPYVGSK